MEKQLISEMYQKYNTKNKE